MSYTRLTDVYEVRPGRDILDMTPEQKHQLLDAATTVSETGKKGLIITFDLSSSFRRTNNRIYSAAGQKAGVDSWTNPYPKPILRNHDKNSDPIGRIISVEWVSNDQQAMAYFDSMNDFMQFKRITDQGNPQKIYKAMLKHNLFTDDTWPGLGKLVAKARISDADAIEKFLDGRYFTFSAGSHTDKYMCGICGSDWATGDVCEHTPGSMSDNGLPAIYFTGKFSGDEASVVTMPGNALSQLTSMEFGDSVELSPVQMDSLKVGSNNIRFTDASVDTGDLMAINTDLQQVIESLKSMDARNVARAIWDNTLSVEQNDALAARTHFETSWLIRVHDALHSEYDWAIRYGDDGAEIPEAVFAFHGDLHELSKGKGFRDSMINGPLDGFDKKGGASEEYAAKRATKDSETKDPGFIDADGDKILKSLLSNSETVAALKAALLDEAAPAAEPAPEVEVEDNKTEEEVPESTSPPEATQEDEAIEPETVLVDWYLLEAALALEVSDARLSDEARAELADEAFAGPERVFPVADAAHVDAARRVMERANLSDEEKAVVGAFVDSRAEALGLVSTEDCVENCACKDLQAKLDTITADYQSSLELATKLQDEVTSLKEKLSTLDTAEEQSHDDSKQTVLNVDDIKKVEDESASSSKALAGTTKDLGDYEKNIVSRYKELRDQHGAQAADRFLNGKYRAGHLPRTFDITPHIQENE